MWGPISAICVASSEPHQARRMQTGGAPTKGSLSQGNGKKKESGVIRCPLPGPHIHCDPPTSCLVFQG